MNVLFYTNQDVSGGPRCILPVSEINRRDKHRAGILIDNPSWVDGVDVAILLRWPNPITIRAYRQEQPKTKIIIDVDDSFWDIPKHHPGYASVGPGSDYANGLLECIKEADIITAPTEFLLDRIRELAGNIDGRVIPNGFPYNPIAKKRIPFFNDKVVIGWAGTATHREDFKEIESVVSILAQSEWFLKKAAFAIGGDLYIYNTFLKNVPRENKVFLPPVRWNTYYDGVISKFNILLAPLPPTAFNNCKSDIKIVDAAYAKIPWLSGIAEPYKVHHGHGGFTCSKPSQWIEAIKEFVLDETKREIAGLEIADHLVDRNISIIARKYEEAVDDLCN